MDYLILPNIIFFLKVTLIFPIFYLIQFSQLYWENILIFDKFVKFVVLFSYRI